MEHKGTEQSAFVLWFTGLSGSGKSTLANHVARQLIGQGRKVERLDGDTLRGLFPNTGFGRQDRDEHIKRVGFMASRLEHHGVVVVASFISPYLEARQFVRKLCSNFIEVYVKASVEECSRRDVKGLYEKVKNGEIKQFTGVNDPYESPSCPEITVDTESQTVEESVKAIMDYLSQL